MENGQFAKLSKRFNVVVHDSKNRSSPISTQWSLKSNRAYLLLITPDETLIQQWGRDLKLDFNETLVIAILRAETEYYESFAGMISFVFTMRSAKSDPAQLSALALQLDAAKYKQRNAASQKLLEYGEPALSFLLTYEAGSLESVSRIRSIIGELSEKKRIVKLLDLDHDVEFLIRNWAKTPQIAEYASRIFPSVKGLENQSQVEFKKWWGTNSSRYDWDQKSKTFRRSEK